MASGNKGGRGEALRKLLLATKKKEETTAASSSTSFGGDLGVKGSSNKPIQTLGRSASLAKLLETFSHGGSGDKSEATARELLPFEETEEIGTCSRVPSRLSLSSRGITRLSYHHETDNSPPEMSQQRQLVLPGRGKPISALQEPGRRSEGSFGTRTRGYLQQYGEIDAALSELDISKDKDEPPVIKKGNYGKEVSLAANYIRLNIAEGKGVFQYHVNVIPEVDSLHVRFQLVQSLRDIIGGTKTFDGSTLYLPHKLPNKIITTNLNLPTDGSKVAVEIKFVKQLRMGDQQTIHLYNVLFRKIMNILGLVLHGRHYFDPKAAMALPAHKLQIWPGYITAIHEYEGGILLNCDSSHRVLRTQTVLELMHDLIRTDSHSWKDEFSKLIIGQTVLTRYNNKVYRIDDITFDECPADTFEKRDGSRISYSDYYHHHYNIQLKDMRQPLLKSRVKGRLKGQEVTGLVNLIPEICYLSGLTDTMRADLRVMKDIAQCTRISPNQRQHALKEFIKNVNKNEESKSILSSWGLSLADNSIKVTGRIIPPEDIYFADEVVHRGNFNADWTRAATSNSVLSAVELNQWAVICTNRDEKVVDGFLQMFKKCAPQLGLQCVLPEVISVPNDSVQNYIKALQSTKGRSKQIVVIVFPICRSDKYSAVKKWCCIENPVPSQVILTRTIRRPDKLRSVTQKIALQINCKLGGTLWAVDIPVKSTMVVGLDTFHDSDSQRKSVGAVVASLNKPLTRWYSKIFIQPPGLEMIDGLEVSILASLQKFKEVNGTYPEQIIVYRDGVGDGQFEVVKEFEIPQIVIACRRISPNYDPKFLFVIVQKRINTRIFAEEKNEFVNPAPGTVLDHTVTRKEYWDFFLVSQCVRQGTVTPTHYVVLYNTTKMSPDQVQRFTYKLTHLYYNWSGTVRVPAPCQYAHKLASLVGESLHKEAAECLADKLFYL